MAEVIGVRFKEGGKVYYFDPDKNKLKNDDVVIVETSRGIECGTVAIANKEVADDEIVHPLKKLIRKATKEDRRRLEENKRKEKEALKICEQKVAEHGLEMKLVDVEYTFDNSKILFYFTADGRVDFRALVKDLASVFRTRIELRQALSFYSGLSTTDPEVKKLTRKLDRARIIALIEVTDQAVRKLKTNINLQLLQTWLSSQYRRITWQK